MNTEHNESFAVCFYLALRTGLSIAHLAVGITVALIFIIKTHAASLNPNDFTSLGPLPYSNLVIDTDGLTSGGAPGVVPITILSPCV